mmetsp:Transcript_70624/g.206747  ORF Transcript_70624/g.206747 Transcript_70624/m.206747 type:complete len:237 (+) Transcript_70624:402-1112(+)
MYRHICLQMETLACLPTHTLGRFPEIEFVGHGLPGVLASLVAPLPTELPAAGDLHRNGDCGIDTMRWLDATECGGTTITCRDRSVGDPCGGILGAPAATCRTPCTGPELTERCVVAGEPSGTGAEGVIAGAGAEGVPQAAQGVPAAPALRPRRAESSSGLRHGERSLESARMATSICTSGKSFCDADRAASGRPAGQDSLFFATPAVGDLLPDRSMSLSALPMCSRPCTSSLSTKA